MLKALLFDLGNTLCDDAGAAREACSRTALRLVTDGHLPAAEEFVRRYFEQNRAYERPFVSHTFGAVEVFDRTLASLGVSTISGERVLSTYRSLLTEGFRLGRGVRDALTLLRERRVLTALVTNESVERVEAYMGRTGLGALLDVVVVSEELGVEKPEPEIFREALGRLGVQPSEAVMLGDNPVADGASIETGISFVLVTGYRDPGWRWERGTEYEPALTIEHVDPSAMELVLRHFGQHQGQTHDEERPRGGREKPFQEDQ